MNTLTSSETAGWARVGRRALVSGSIASLLSTAALALLGKIRLGKPAAPTNATSHWLWGDAAYDAHEPSVRHTGIGYATHHASAVFWALLFERWLDRRHHHRTGEILRDAALMTGIAAFVDYQLTPPRLRPGFEKHLSRGSLLGVFVALGAGWAAGALLNSQRERRLDRILSFPDEAEFPKRVPSGSSLRTPEESRRHSDPRGNQVTAESVAAGSR